MDLFSIENGPTIDYQYVMDQKISLYICTSYGAGEIIQLLIGFQILKCSWIDFGGKESHYKKQQLIICVVGYGIRRKISKECFGICHM